MKSRETEPAHRAGQVLIIGMGNPLRGDDALGRVIAERIAETARPEGIQVLVVHQLTPELAEPISRADLVIFLDAAADLEPGRMKVRLILPAVTSAHSLEHDMGPAQLLSTARALYGRCPEAWTISVGGQFWGYGEGLSMLLEGLVPRLMHQVELLIAARTASEANHA